jgi:hypothetical protein
MAVVLPACTGSALRPRKRGRRGKTVVRMFPAVGVNARARQKQAVPCRVRSRAPGRRDAAAAAARVHQGRKPTSCSEHNSPSCWRILRSWAQPAGAKTAAGPLSRNSRKRTCSLRNRVARGDVARRCTRRTARPWNGPGIPRGTRPTAPNCTPRYRHVHGASSSQAPCAGPAKRPSRWKGNHACYSLLYRRLVRQSTPLRSSLGSMPGVRRSP